MKKKTFHFSINSFLSSQSDYLDGCQIYLLDLQNTDILDHIDPFFCLLNKKMSLEKISHRGKVGILIFLKGVILYQKDKRITELFLSELAFCC